MVSAADRPPWYPPSPPYRGFLALPCSLYIHPYINSVMMLCCCLLRLFLRLFSHLFLFLFLCSLSLFYCLVYDWCSAVHAAGVRVYPLALSALRCVVIRGSSLALTVWPMLAVLPYAYDSAEYVTTTLAWLYGRLFYCTTLPLWYAVVTAGDTWE